MEMIMNFTGMFFTVVIVFITGFFVGYTWKEGKDLRNRKTGRMMAADKFENVVKRNNADLEGY